MGIQSKVYIGLIGVIICLTIIFFILRESREQILSCHNHERFIELYIKDFLEKNKHIPYDTDKVGYAFFAEWTSHYSTHTNCIHGAPKSSFGGWQFVNLSPNIWDEIFNLWEPSYGDPIPLLWCGQSTKLQRRVLVGIQFRPEQTPAAITHYNMEEKELQERLQRLNGILDRLGKKKVDLNVPKNIDWDQFTNSGASK